MRNILRISLIVIFVFYIQNSYGQEITCTLKGELYDFDGKEIILQKFTDLDERMGLPIPVKDKRFEYTLNVPSMELYQLVIDEDPVVKPILFFPDSDTINFTLYPYEQYSKSTIKGGELTREVSSFYQLYAKKYETVHAGMDSLRSINKYFTEGYQDLNTRIKQAESEQNEILRDSLVRELQLLEDNRKFTHEALQYKSQAKLIKKEMIESQLNYIKNHQNIYAYYLLYLHTVNFTEYDTAFSTELYQSFAEKYPTHPCTKLISDKLDANKTIRVGGKYIDFEAPDIDRHLVKISRVINGKVALIDFWASWCGPCRLTSKSMIPVYEKYKERGFTVIGIAREYKNIESFKNTLQQDKYPWLNLVELNEKNEVWNKYGISNFAGSTYLVDREGIILAINPSPSEVEEILEEILH